MNDRYATPSEACEELANAIVAKAAQDYKTAYMNFLDNPHDAKYKAAVSELRVFFDSDWYRALTTLDAECLLEPIERECKEKHAIKMKILNKRKGKSSWK